MKRIAVIVVAVLAVAIVLGAIKDAIIKTSVEKGVEIVTGLPLKIGGMKVGIIRTLISVKNLTLFNPKNYPDKLMLDMPEVYVNYNLGSIIGGKIHLKEMRINLREFAVIKNENGELNINSLKVVAAQKEGRSPEDSGGGKKGKAPEIQIDTLKLKVGRIVYKDYSKGGAPEIKKFSANIDETYNNITNPYSLVSLILVKSLMATPIARYVNIDLRGLQTKASETLSQAADEAKKFVSEAKAELEKRMQESKKSAEEAMQKAKQAAEEAKESFKKTAEDLENIKLPFGGGDE